MIRVHRGDAEKDGGCLECHARNDILVMDVGRDRLRLCTGCAADLMGAIVMATREAPKAKAAKKGGKRKSAKAPDPISVACPTCHSAAESPCDKGDARTPVGPDGYHYARVGEARRGMPMTRVRDMAPHVPARPRRPKPIPKPYKARKAG